MVRKGIQPHPFHRVHRHQKQKGKIAHFHIRVALLLQAVKSKCYLIVHFQGYSEELGVMAYTLWSTRSCFRNLSVSISGTTLGSKGPGQVSQYQAGLTLVGAGGTGTNLPMHNPTIGGINAANKFNTISNVHKRGGGGGIGWNRSLMQEEQVEIISK